MALSASAWAYQPTTDPAMPDKVTPDVTGLQRVVVVGCRFADTNYYQLLDASSSGIGTILDHTHGYFNVVSNGRVDFQAQFLGWEDLPGGSDGYPDADKYHHGEEAIRLSKHRAPTSRGTERQCSQL